MTYRTFTRDELDKILADHKEWLNDNTRGARADLSYADLSYADLHHANLSSADLSYADLRSAGLRYADLRYADLHSADLRSADLRYADLRYADLHSADLHSADLRYANLLIFQFQRHTAYFTLDGSLRIGCHVLPISEWANTYQDIGKNEGYSEAQIKAYGGFIKLCLEQFEIHAEKKT